MATTTEDELEMMKRKVKEMEEEALKFKEMHASIEKEMSSSTESPGLAEKEAIDHRSIYVGNVDYSATPEELSNHFSSCGIINRVTILCDKYSGQPKGFAYVEFADESSANNAVALNESLFKGRLIKVSSKRTNVPFYYGKPRGGPHPPYMYRGGGSFRGGPGHFRGNFRGRGGPFRGGRGARFAPY